MRTRAWASTLLASSWFLPGLGIVRSFPDRSLPLFTICFIFAPPSGTAGQVIDRMSAGLSSPRASVNAYSALLMAMSLSVTPEPVRAVEIAEGQQGRPALVVTYSAMPPSRPVGGA